MIPVDQTTKAGAEVYADSGALWVQVKSGGGGGGGEVTVADGADVAQGTTTQTAAAADGTGNYSLIQAAKRALLNWSTLLSRIPALVSGRIPVDGSGVTQPVSGPLTAAELTTAALATDAVAQAIRDRLPSAFLTPGLFAVDVLGTPGVARVQATSGTAANIVLTTSCRRVSMFATQGAWYAISGTATSSSHYIGTGERLDFDVPASTTVSVLQESAAGSIRITELG